jgi:predicted transcriptional regulator of viral defense system
MTTDQRAILNFVRSKGEATKREICEIADRYYCNGDNYVGERLSRMVDAGLLERVRPGVFRVGKGKEKPAKVEPGNENQLNLF